MWNVTYENYTRPVTMSVLFDCLTYIFLVVGLVTSANMISIMQFLKVGCVHETSVFLSVSNHVQ